MHIENREADALEYIKEHRLDGLFKQLCELLIYNQPIDPRAFLIEQLEKMVATRDNGSDPPTLLDMSNLVAIFGLIDVTQRGSISLSEALSALKKVGIEEDIFQIDPVPREVFIRKTQSALYEMGNNFKPVPM